MVQVKKFGQMVQFMKETFLMIKNMVLGILSGKMALLIQDKCNKIYFMVKGFINGLMEVIMRVIFN